MVALRDAGKRVLLPRQTVKLQPLGVRAVDWLVQPLGFSRMLTQIGASTPREIEEPPERPRVCAYFVAFEPRVGGTDRPPEITFRIQRPTDFLIRVHADSFG